jgi:hypothetical protein
MNQTNAQQANANDVTYALKVIGIVRHDNKLFDVKCPSCGGIYSSGEVATCPKCGGGLALITTKNGTPMSISEGTVDPILTEDQQQYQKNLAGSIKGGATPEYRFSLFNYGEGNNPAPPHHLHYQMKAGKCIKFITMNHVNRIKVFERDDNSLGVEIGVLINPKHGDQFEILPDVERNRIQELKGVKPPPMVQPDALPQADSAESSDIEQRLSNLENLLTQFLTALNSGNTQPQPSNENDRPDIDIGSLMSEDGWIKCDD